jgi:dynein intermediate chain
MHGVHHRTGLHHNYIASGKYNLSTRLAPTLDFASEDVVYDPRWSLTRLGVFAMVDRSGMLEVWDLLQGLEIPVTKATPLPNKKASGAIYSKSLNKVA